MKIKGKVIKGDSQGRKQGYPTANLNPNIIRRKFAKGIYACFAQYKNQKEKAILIYGAPNIKGNAKLEVFFLKKPLAVFNKEISVEIVKRIRPLKKFETKEAFFTQIKKDIAKAAEILAS